MIKTYAIAMSLLIGLVIPVQAQMVVPTEQISFPAGSDTTTIRHTIVGEEVYGYTFQGVAGQSVTVSLDAVTPSANFLLTRTGDDAALYSSMTGDKTHTETLPQDGQYEIRLFLVGQAASTGSSDMTVTVTLSGGGAGVDAMASDTMSSEMPMGDYADGLSGGPDFWEVHGLSGADSLNVRSGPGTNHAVVGTVGNGDILRNQGCAQPGTTVWCQIESTDGRNLSGWASNAYLREGGAPQAGGDAMVEGTNYHAVGSLPCTIEANASVSSCEFGVTRGQPGIATVFITLPNGFVRVISFSDGMVSPQSAVTTFDFEQMGDETSVTIDNGAEIYVIPDAIIFGG